MKQRLIASGVHFLGSAAVISIFLMLVYFVWYSYPYNIVYAALDVVKIVVGVDLVLGPMLTLVIFNLAKPRSELIRDMSIIICFQLAALSWGVYATYKVRPLFSVYYNGTFYTVTGDDVDLSKLNEQVKKPGMLEGARIVYAKDVTNQEEIVRVYERLQEGGKGIMYSPERYEPVSDYIEEIKKRDIGYEYIGKVGKKQIIDAFLQRHGKELAEFRYYPFVSGIEGGQGYLVVDKNSGQIVDVFK